MSFDNPPPALPVQAVQMLSAEIAHRMPGKLSMVPFPSGIERTEFGRTDGIDRDDRTMKRSLMLMAVSTIVLGMLGCDALRDYPKKIQEFPEPWKIVEPGTPRERFPTPRVISEGSGATIATGDLVQLHIRNKWVDEGTWHERGNWWVWVGFRTPSDTSFFSTEPRVASALVGLREGSTIEFVDGNDGTGKDPEYAGVLRLNVFGDQSYYKWRKNVEGGSANIYVTTAGTPSQIEIKRVCKGQTKYRTVRLFDDSPVRTGSGFNTKVTRDPRELWIDEAKIEATCQDGRKVVFRYGPTGSKSGGKPRFVVTGYFDDWLYEAWKKLDVGVQFEGNRPPEAKKDMFETQADKAIRIDMLSNDRDTEGDKLSARITVVPGHGKLVANGDGAWTYTPAQGWAGTDFVRYRASDGLVESAETFVEIRVVKR